MGFLESLKRALAGAPRSRPDDGLYYYIRCARCGDRVRVRVGPSSELQQEFEGRGEDPEGYSVRKMVVDQRCFRPIELRLRFDSRRRETTREIEGGTFMTAAEYAAEA
jgi:hypothetical protein